MADAGRFIWYDLLTTDVKAATRFYSAVVGWTIKDSGMPEADGYMLLHPPGESNAIGGMMARRPEMGDVPPFWGGYLYANDVDATAQRLTSLGGSVHRGPMDIPHVGRFAVVSDPQGGAFYLFSPSGEGALADKLEPGFVGWRELHSTDPKAAFAFYSELAGWSKERDTDMGAHGTYTVWKAKDGQQGGLMKAQHPHTAWLYYFVVPSVEKAAEIVTREGGKILTSVMQEPTGGWITHCTDPQGAMFGLCGKK